MELQSPEIHEIAAALSAAQGEFDAATKDKSNPAFPRSKYADLSACIEAVRPHLTKHGLAVVQTMVSSEKDVLLRSVLMHKSGQWIASYFPIMGDWSNPQKIGSATTYARRYTLCALLQIAQEDDDAEAAMGRGAGASNGHSQRADRYSADDRREQPTTAERIAGTAARQAPARPAPRAEGPPVDESFGEPPPRRR